MYVNTAPFTVKGALRCVVVVFVAARPGSLVMVSLCLDAIDSPYPPLPPHRIVRCICASIQHITKYQSKLDV